MHDRPRRPRWLLWLLGASLAAGVALVAWLHGWPGRSFPLPPYSASRFRNTGPEAQYIGTAACAACHESKHRSYLLTAHSRALSDLDPRAEPPDGSFVHQASGRSYRVYRQDGQFRHEEVLRTPEGKEIARMDLPIRYLVGSGHFARTYLVEVDGFLHESPITWYASKKQWGMSPGYDAPRHQGFERQVQGQCLTCHAGRVESAGTAHRLTFPEKAIGCENCHGPGAEHAAWQRAGKHVPGEEDLTIVNPKNLSRPLREDICAACHLNAAASVPLRGRRVDAFRPGRPLTDYRTDYRLDADNEQMTVVGHVEQLRQSACYQKSGDLTCVTCHDPHEPEKPKDPIAFYRQKCLDCHTTQACRLEQAQRLQKDAADNCAACHMPRSDTDIPHLAFTHHRIGRHTPRPPSDPERVPELVPIDDVAHLTPLDQKRNLGLAYLQAPRNPIYAQYGTAFAERARGLLEGVYDAGLRDPETAEALAEIFAEKDPAVSSKYAQQALAAKDIPAEVRAQALYLLAKGEAESLHFPAAIGSLKELLRLRRSGEDYCLLGMCYLAQNQPQDALQALQQALAIRPDHQAVHLGLAAAYQRLGDGQRAREHGEKAQWLLRHHPQ